MQWQAMLSLNRVNPQLTLKTVVSEFNSINWTDNSWDKKNVAGKGLMNFDQLGQLLLDDNCIYACYWNTRWFEDAGSIFDAFDENNELLAAARPFALWGEFVEKDLVETSVDSNGLVTYASHDTTTGNLSIFIINKTNSAQEVSLVLNSNKNYSTSLKIKQYKGVNENDTNPSMDTMQNLEITNNKIESLTVPGVSITALALQSI